MKETETVRGFAAFLQAQGVLSAKDAASAQDALRAAVEKVTPKGGMRAEPGKGSGDISFPAFKMVDATRALLEGKIWLSAFWKLLVRCGFAPDEIGPDVQSPLGQRVAELF